MVIARRWRSFAIPSRDCRCRPAFLGPADECDFAIPEKWRCSKASAAGFVVHQERMMEPRLQLARDHGGNVALSMSRAAFDVYSIQWRRRLVLPRALQQSAVRFDSGRESLCASARWNERRLIQSVFDAAHDGRAVGSVMSKPSLQGVVSCCYEGNRAADWDDIPDAAAGNAFFGVCRI